MSKKYAELKIGNKTINVIIFLFINKFPFESSDALYKKAIYYPSLGV